MGDRQVLSVHNAAVDCANGQAIHTTPQHIERDVTGALAAELERTAIADGLASTPAGRDLNARRSPTERR